MRQVLLVFFLLCDRLMFKLSFHGFSNFRCALPMGCFCFCCFVEIVC